MIVLDIIILMMLIITIFYCLKLNKKIVELQDGKRELALLFKYFDEEIKRAEKGIEGLKNVSDRGTHIIDTKLREAQIIIDELAIIIDNATRTVKNLENVSAKSMLKEQMVRQEVSNTRREIFEHNKSSLHTDLAPPRPNINTSQNSYPIEPDVRSNYSTETKRIAIEALLDKISEIQKKNRKADA